MEVQGHDDTSSIHPIGRCNRRGFGIRRPLRAQSEHRLGVYQSPGGPIAGRNWPGIAKFATALRGVGPGGIPVAVSDGTSATGAVHYALDVAEYTDQLHPT